MKSKLSLFLAAIVLCTTLVFAQIEDEDEPYRRKAANVLSLEMLLSTMSMLSILCSQIFCSPIASASFPFRATLLRLSYIMIITYKSNCGAFAQAYDCVSSPYSSISLLLVSAAVV